MHSVDEVLSAIEQKVQHLPVEYLPLAQAWGQVLAAPVVMSDDSPPFDRAQLDGYAVVAAEVWEGAVLEVVGQVNAGGGVGGERVRLAGSGKCLAINTGAPMPTGANAVLMVEHSEKVPPQDGKIFVRAKKLVSVGQGIQKRGSDAGVGDTVLQPGCRLWAPQLAICAAAGVRGGPGGGGVPVRRLRAALLTTGDELVDPATTPALGQIRNSNHPMLSALLRRAAAVSAGDGLIDLGTCGDDADKLRNLLATGLEQADLLVVSGGMSMGTKDLVPPLLKELGVQFFVEKVRVKPGKPFIFGARPRAGGRGDAYVAGLPGNPVSAFVTFHRFVRAIIARLLGETGNNRVIEAIAGAEIAANDEREFYQPCILRRAGGMVTAEPLRWKGSANIFILAQADAMIVRPAGAGLVRAGALVRVLLL